MVLQRRSFARAWFQAWRARWLQHSHVICAPPHFKRFRFNRLPDHVAQGVMKFRDEKEAVRDICDANGLSKDVFEKKPASVTRIEMMMFNFPKLQGLGAFVGLLELTILQQSISELEGLQHLVNLQKLWVCETNIAVIEGLSGLKKLKNLYLYSNRIQKIENLVDLPSLEVLWLSGNEISTIENVGHLTSLTQLHLASNKLFYIGPGLSALCNLEELVLSGNFLWSFKDALNLRELPLLSRLNLGDPEHGDNPVCELCNYYTYCLYHLQQLTCLDTLSVSEDAKQAAEGTYMKKKMYYNMRMKTIKRNASNLTRYARDHLRQRTESLSASMRWLSHCKHDLEEAMAEHVPSADLIKAKIAAVDQSLASISADDVALRGYFESFKKSVSDMCESTFARMIVELETGGNVRLEDGKPSDVWYTSCSDLVRSRLNIGDMHHLGVRDVSITRVLRIHNRVLRNRFEEKLESLVDFNDPSYKKNLEYLFLMNDSPNCTDVLRSVELGFDYIDSADAPLSLSNSFATVEMPRIQGKTSRSDGRGLVPSPCLLLVAKVYAANYGPEEPGKAPLKSNYPKFDSVYRQTSEDGRQRQWFIFDHYLVMPEYLVEIEYIGEQHVLPLSTDLMFSALECTPQSRKELEAPDSLPLVRKLAQFLPHCKVGTMPEVSPQETISRMPPKLPMRPAFAAVTPDAIIAAAPANLSPSKSPQSGSFMHLTSLNLASLSLRSLDGIDACVMLKDVAFPHNFVTSLEPISRLKHIACVVASFNQLRRLDHVSNCASLRVLNSAFNCISRSEDLAHIRKHMTQVTELNLIGNSICEIKSYRQYLLRRMTNLVSLDAKAVSQSERESSRETTFSVTISHIKELGFSKRRSGRDWSLIPSSLNRFPLDADRSSLQQDDTVLWEKTVGLDLIGRKIRKLTNFDKLVNLKVLSLADNEISVLSGLEHLVVLEELILDSNRLTSLSGIEHLTKLIVLEAGKNRLTRVSHVCHLLSLTQLSLEDNDIESIEGITQLPNLMDLYLANNRLADSKEVTSLKELPRLIILDLSGNYVVSSVEKYRLFMIFHLKKLKVLDGIAIESDEMTMSVEVFSGRLSEESLISRISGLNFKQVRELDLSNMKIRDLADVLNGSVLCNLKVLNLDHNLISDCVGLSSLVSLSVLRLNHNKIDFAPGKCDCRGFESLVNLEVLQLSNNEITSIEKFRKLPLHLLKVLFLQDNSISKIESIEHLTCLKELILDRNRIRALEVNSLQNLVGLCELRLEENGLRSLQHIGPMPKLLSLFASSNRLSDAVEIDRLSVITSLTELNMSNTPLSRKPNYRTIVIFRCPHLRFLDCKEVSFDERERVASMFQSQEVYRPPALQMNPAFFSGPITAQLQQQQQQQQQPTLATQQLQIPQSKTLLGRGSLSLEVVSSAALPSGTNAASDRFTSPILCIGLTKQPDDSSTQPNSMLPIAKQVFFLVSSLV
jgi:Leucine-rich repeat (LRR) protein